MDRKLIRNNDIFAFEIFQTTNARPLVGDKNRAVFVTEQDQLDFFP